MVSKNCKVAEFVSDGGSISIHDAIASSCALPFLVQPFRFQNRHYLDGGLYSNLPVNVAFGSGAMGEIVLYV